MNKQNNLIKRIMGYLYNRDIDINERLSIFFIAMGIFAALFGTIICIASGVPLIGILITLSLPITAVILLGIFHRSGDYDKCRFFMSIGVSILIPLVWLTSGGSESGVILWFVFAWFFLTLNEFKGKQIIVLPITLILHVSCYIYEYFNYDKLFHFATTWQRNISIMGSMTVVSICISLTIIVMLSLYRNENALANTRADEYYAINEELQATVEDLNQANLALEKANSAQKRFLASMSHEIRTPINGILGMNEMIKRECDNEKIEEYAVHVEESGKHLMALVNDILDFSKIESDKMELIDDNYKYSSVISDSVLLTRVKSDEKGLILKVDIAKDVPDDLYGDERRLRQIFLNLLSNAVKYTEKGQIDFALSVGETKGDMVQLKFSVKDTGKGIKADDKYVVFEAFKRDDANRNKFVEGTGLGLPITKSLIEQMGGEIFVESTYGAGTEFYGYIYQKKTSDKCIDSLTQSKTEKAEEVKTYHETFTAPEAKILVVDDTPINLILMKKLLSRTEVSVTTVASGNEALEVLKNEQFDVLFLDHMMPEMDGIELFEIIKKESLAENVPVIMLTANAVSGMREMFLEKGFTDFLPKPVKWQDLEAMLRQYIPDEKLVITQAEDNQ